MSVWTLHPSAQQRALAMQLATDLLGGTEAMRGGSSFQDAKSGRSATRDGDAGWLVRFESDEDATFRRRWDRAFLFGAFADAVGRVGAKMFAEPLDVQGLPEGLALLTANADRNGCDLHTFADRHFRRKVAFGVAAILVAMPSASELPADARTPDGDVSVQGMQRYRVAPYFVAIHRSAITDWEWQDRPEGGRRLTRFAFREPDVWARDAKNAIQQRERLRLYTTTDAGVLVEVFERSASARDRKKGDGESPIESAMLPVSEIPVVIDFAPDADETEDPLATSLPLDELAWTNLQHFRETAEQGVALLASRSEGAVEMGCDEKDLGSPLRFGFSRARRTTLPPGSYDLKFVGPSGRGVELGEGSLEKIEARMARLGAAPLQRQSGNATATSAAMDEARTDVQAASWARGTEAALAQAFRIADAMQTQGAGAMDERLPDLVVTLKGKSLIDATTSTAEANFALLAWERGAITHRTLLERLVELGKLPKDADLDAMVDEVAQEGAERFRRQAELAIAGGLGGGAGSGQDQESDPDADPQEWIDEQRRSSRPAEPAGNGTHGALRRGADRRVEAL